MLVYVNYASIVKSQLSMRLRENQKKCQSYSVKFNLFSLLWELKNWPLNASVCLTQVFCKTDTKCMTTSRSENLLTPFQRFVLVYLYKGPNPPLPAGNRNQPMYDFSVLVALKACFTFSAEIGLYSFHKISRNISHV